MKKPLSQPYTFILLLGAMLIGGAAAGQGQIEDTWRIGASVGYMSYYGDVSPYQIGKWADWDKAFRFFQHNRHYIPEASYGISLERRLTPTTGLLFQLDHGKFGMSDRYQMVSGGENSAAPHWSRALNFQTSVLDLGTGLIFRSDNRHFLRENAFLAPYVYLGAGLTRFSVKGDLYDANGNPYDYSDPHVKPDGVYETNLRPLLTETEKEYPDLTGYADLGLGLTFHLGSRVSLSVETDMRYAFTDYLDDVHGKYKTVYTACVQAYAAHPGTNVIDPVTRKRGNNDGVNDMVFFQKITLQYSFGRGRKPRFSAPFIYEPRLPLSTSSAATLLPEDTLAPPSDSLSDRARRDGTKLTENEPDTRITQELQDLKNQFRAYRFTEIDQQYLFQEIEVRRQLKALSAAQNSLTGKQGVRKSDSLIFGQYGGQIDSLQRRLAAIHRARELLRQEVVYSPIVTEYADSTKIMIYKRAESADSDYMPLIGDAAYPNDQKTLSERKINPSRPSIPPPSDSEAAPSKEGPRSAADSLRYVLDAEIQAAQENGDSSLVLQLYRLRYRVDSLRNSEGIDSVYLLNQARIREDSLRLGQLLQDSDTGSLDGDHSGGGVYTDTVRRNFIQRFLDQFRRRQKQSLSPSVPLGYSASTPIENTEPQAAAPHTATADYPRETLSDQSDEIASLREDIARLRQQNETYYRNPPQTVYLPGSDRIGRRDARRDRNALYALGRSIERSGRNRSTPTVAPQIVLDGASRSDDRELRDLRAQLTALQSQEAAQHDSLAALSNTPRDSVNGQTQGRNTAIMPPGQLRPLEQRIDSLGAQLALLRATTRDTLSTLPTVPAAVKSAFIVENYPVVSTYFATGTAHLSPKELEKLRPIAEMAKAHPEMRLLIQGYTDGTGSSTVNKALAEKRCEMVRNILVDSYQIPEARLQVAPVGPPEGSGNNPLLRRVDIRIRSAQ